MRKTLYSASARRRGGEIPPGQEPLRDDARASVEKPRERAWRRLYRRHEKPVLAIGGALVALGVVFAQAGLHRAPQVTQQDIDAAVARTLDKHPIPSPSIKAYQAVAPSIVRVMAVHDDGVPIDGHLHGEEGTGVVIIDRGVILTCLHVVSGASRVRVLFGNGLESEASVIAKRPENDLAVLQAKQVPDDLKAATLRSAKDLVEGQGITAVGFPFGIGPSVSAGVISGLRREYASPNGKRRLHDLIQFDAAANPGSSGGPLVNAAGEVVGIVTAILSPGDKAGFAGIAFAVPIDSAASAAGLPPF